MSSSIPPVSKPIQHVMLIDDDCADNFLHLRELEKSGLVLNVEVFEHAEDALSALRSDLSQFDLIFVDINMPRVDGFAFLDALDELEYDPDNSPAVIVLSTSIGPKESQRAAASDLVMKTELKPLSQEKFVEIVRRYTTEYSKQL